MPARVRRRRAAPVSVAVVLATALAAAVVTVTAPPAAAEPANDDLVNAEAIAVGATVDTNTFEATRELDEPSACGLQIDRTVWFAVTPTESTTLTVRTLSANPLMDTVLAVHTGGEPLVCNDDHSGRRSKVTFPATAGVTYYLQVGHYGGTPLTGDPGPGPLQVQVVEQPAPTNDNVATPEAVSGATGEAAVDTTLATHAAGDPSQPTATSHTLWYEWQATTDGVVAFDTRTDRPEHPDTFLFAFPEDGATTTGTALAFNDDVGGANRGSRITFDVAAGTTYRILAGTRSGHDPFRLGWSESDPVATTTDLEATSPSAGLVDLAVVVTREDDEVPSGSVAISDGDDLVATLPLSGTGTAGRRLRYRTAGTHDYSAAFQPDGPLEQPSSSPEVSVPVAAPARPANDDFADAAALTGISGTVADIALAGATAEPDEALDPAVDGASVWYRWRAPVSDTFTFTVATADPAVDSVVGALRGSQPGDLTVLSASREPAGPGSQITFSAIGGRDYYLQVDAVVAGTVSLAWSRAGGTDTVTTLEATSPSPYVVHLVSHTTGASVGTVIFLRNGAVIGRVPTTDGDAQLDPPFQRPGTGTFTAEFYPDDPAVRPSASAPRVLEVAAPEEAPDNDRFLDAEPLGGPTGSVLGTTFGATADPGTPATALPSAADTTVWYRWVAPDDGSFTFLVTRTMPGVDTVLRAFEGTTLATLRTLDENDDDTGESTSRVGISAVKGRVYHLAVDAYSLSGIGPFQLTWGGFTPTKTSTTWLTATSNGLTVKLTATVGPPTAHLTGFVQFFEGTASRGQVWVTAANGTVSRTLTNVATGRRTYRAVFVPDDYRYRRSQASWTVTVPKAASRTTLTAPSRLGVGARPVVSSVVKVGTANATGSVRFMLNGRVLRTVALRGGRASLQLPALRAGTAYVVATYLGTTRAVPSSAARAIVVRR